jgi:AsmA protein
MGRILKWLLYALGGVVALLVLFVGVVLLVVDPNDYRGRIEQVVEQQTGRALAIEGDLDLTFFPWFGIEVGGIRLAEAEGFGEEPFVSVERVQLAVKVLPLLSGELALDTIVLEQPRIRLVRLEDGRANWESLAPPAGEPAPSEQPPAGTEPGGVPDLLASARLEGFLIRDAHVTYIDRQAGVSATLDPFDLTLEDVRFGAPFPASAEWGATLADGPSVDGSLKAVLQVAPDLSQAQINGLDLQLTARGEAIPTGSQTLRITGEVDADLAQQVFSVPQLTLAAAGAEINAQAEARLAGTAPAASGSITLPEVSPRAIFEQLGMQPPPTRDESVLTALQAQSRFQFADGRLTLDGVEARLDDTRLDGQVVVSDFAAPAVDFRFTVDGINVDRYLPPPAADGAEPVADTGGAPSPGAEEIAELPLEPLRSLDLNGTLQVGSLTVSGATLSDIDITVIAENGRIRAHPLTAQLYGGSYAGDLRLDVTGNTPVVSLDEALTGIRAEPLLTDLAGFGRLLGVGDFTIEARASGMDVDSILESLIGQARFSFADGAIKGINVAQMIRRGMAALTGQPVADVEAPERTDFTALDGTLTFDGGRVRNDDLEISTPLLRIAGGGTANLLQQTLDYRLTVKVVGTLEGQGGAGLEQLKGVPIPLHFSGPMMAPDIDLALEGALRNAVAERVEQKREEVEEKVEEKVEQEIEEKVGDKIPEGIRGLFGR